MNRLKITLIVLTTLLLSACKEAAPSGALTGYIEAINTFVIAPESGYLQQSTLTEGQKVTPWQVVGQLDSDYQALALTQAQSQTAQAQASYENLLSGERPQELAVVEQSLKAQQARTHEAKLALARQQQLLSQQLTSQANVDSAQAAYDSALATTEQLKEEIKARALPAREQAIAAAKAAITSAQEQQKIARWQVDHRRILSPSSGTVDEVFFRQGEFVNQGQPIAMLVDDKRMKVRFYLPQSSLSAISSGQSITIKSDAGDQVNASVSFIAKEPAFAPPVLYGSTSRDKLVFLVEATISGSTSLRQGQPVDIVL